MDTLEPLMLLLNIETAMHTIMAPCFIELLYSLLYSFSLERFRSFPVPALPFTLNNLI